MTDATRRVEKPRDQSAMSAPKNNIGLFRLILASSVIVGHSPEIIDGNRSREPLTLLFHTISLGGLAVTGFFVISGYLITQSMISSRGLSNFLMRRVTRIYPAYIVAFLLCIVVVLPLTGGHFAALGATMIDMITLKRPPHYPGMMVGLRDPDLNGSMWTISYEFRCYLLTAALGVGGVLQRRWLLLCMTIALLVAAEATTFAHVQAVLSSLKAFAHVEAAFGDFTQTINLTASFLVGSCFFVFRDTLITRSRWFYPTIALVALIPSMYNSHLVVLTVDILGAYILLYLAFKARLGSLQKINDRWDISYGTYLYGWPVAITLLWFDRDIAPWQLTAVALPSALLCGALSWWGVEKWAKDLGRPRKPK